MLCTSGLYSIWIPRIKIDFESGLYPGFPSLAQPFAFVPP